jgi:hypothetical protein
VAAALAASPAAAQGEQNATSVARDLAVEGRTAFAAGEYARARELFHRAYALVGAPTVALYEARALVRLGHLTEAADLYRRTVNTPTDAKAPEQFRKAVADAATELAALEPRLSTVKLELSGAPDPTITVDGFAAAATMLDSGSPLDPGTHRIDVAAGGTSKTVTFTLSEGEHRRVSVEFAGSTPAKSAPSLAVAAEPASVQEPARPLRPWAFVSFGVGALGLGAGIVTGVMATNKHSAAESGCPAHRCIDGSQGASDASAFRRLSVASTVGYVVGAVGVAGGVTLLLLEPRAKDRASGRVEMFVDPGRAGVRGAF